MKGGGEHDSIKNVSFRARSFETSQSVMDVNCIVDMCGRVVDRDWWTFVLRTGAVSQLELDSEDEDYARMLMSRATVACITLSLCLYCVRDFVKWNRASTLHRSYKYSYSIFEFEFVANLNCAILNTSNRRTSDPQISAPLRAQLLSIIWLTHRTSYPLVRLTFLIVLFYRYLYHLDSPSSRWH